MTTPPIAPALAGNGRHAYVVGSATAPTLPLTITGASNDQIEFGEAEFLIPAGTSATILALCAALNACTNDEDNAGALLSTLVYFTPSRSDPTKVKAVAIAAGAVTSTFGTAVENSGLAAIGFTDGDALAGGDPVD